MIPLKIASKDGLEYDLLFIIEYGIDEYVKLRDNEKHGQRVCRTI